MKLSVLKQSLKQLWGMIVLEYKYNGRFPDTENFRSPNRYSLPFVGRWTVVNGGVTEKISHSWEIPTQRYAYDFLILDQNGKSCCGDETKPSSFYCYGKDILAPADGTIAEVGKGNPDSRITKKRIVSCDSHDIRGNYILIEHANQEYSLLAHLKPDSILVSVGQKVKCGEKIAQCGNSGNTTEPHLHFHIQQGKSFYTSPGLPIVFSDMIVDAVPGYENYDDRRLDEEGRKHFPPYIFAGQAVENAVSPARSNKAKER